MQLACTECSFVDRQYFERPLISCIFNYPAKTREVCPYFADLERHGDFGVCHISLYCAHEILLLHAIGCMNLTLMLCDKFQGLGISDSIRQVHQNINVDLWRGLYFLQIQEIGVLAIRPQKSTLKVVSARQVVLAEMKGVQDAAPKSGVLI